MSTQSIDRTIHKIQKRAGITKDISAHSLRRTAATTMYKMGFGIKEIQDVLGHSSSGTTDIYLKGLDGSATAVTSNESALALGIEDFWGNCWSYIDGAVCYAGKTYFKDVETIQTDPTVNDLASWTPTTSTYPNGGNNTLITAIANDADYDWLFTPSSDTNATTQTVNDNFWSAYGLQAPFVGGNAWFGSLCGLFAFACNNAVGWVSVDCGFCAIA